MSSDKKALIVVFISWLFLISELAFNISQSVLMQHFSIIFLLISLGFAVAGTRKLVKNVLPYSQNSFIKVSVIILIGFLLAQYLVLPFLQNVSYSYLPLMGIMSLFG